MLLLPVRIRQTVSEHTINQALIAELCACAHIGEVVRGVGHGLGAAGNDDVGVTGHDSLSAESDSFDSRGADFVDGGADGRGFEAGAEGTLASRVLAEAVTL